MTISIVSTTAQLIAALHGAATGDVIKLAPGVYSSVNISGSKFSVLHSGGASQVYIESEYASQPAVLKDFKISNSVGLAFVDLKMSTVGDAVSQYGVAATTPFNINKSSNITFRSMSVSGDPGGTLDTTLSGMLIEDSSHISITASDFTYLHNAINQDDNSYVSITNNTFNHIYDDGVRGGGTSNINVSGNSFNTFHMDPTDTDHADLIQFWTTNETVSASNITVNNNTYVRGVGGGAVQGLFIKDQVGNVPYLNVTAEYNNFTGTLWNGINFGDVHGGLLAYNTVVSYLDYNSSIDIYAGSMNVLEEYNQAESYQYTGSTDYTLIGNILNHPVPAPTKAQIPAQFAAFDGFTAVPEPANWALMITGFALIGAFARRRTIARQA